MKITKFSNRSSHKKYIFIFCIFLNLSSKGVSLAFAAPSDSDFFNLLDSLCNTNPPTNPSQELINLCQDTFVGGGAGGGGVGFSTSVNSGTSGSLGRSSLQITNKLKKRISERLDDIEKEKKQNGGASGDDISANLGTFFSGYYSELDRSQTILENGFKSQGEGAVVGVDYRFTDSIAAGLAAGYANNNANFEANAGGLDYESWNLSTYGNIVPLDNMSIDLYAGYTAIDFQNTRAVNFARSSGTIIRQGVVQGNTNGRQYFTGFATTYTFNSGGISIVPELKFDYINTEIKGYSETGSTDFELDYNKQIIHSLTTSLGTTLSYAQSTPWAVLIPQARAYYVHEYQNDSRNIRGAMVIAPTGILNRATDKPDRDYIVWGVGMSSVFARGVNAFIDYEYLSGHYFLDSWTVSAGMRFELD